MKGEVVCVRGRWLEVCSDIKSFTPPSPTTLKACQDDVVEPFAFKDQTLCLKKGNEKCRKPAVTPTLQEISF